MKISELQAELEKYKQLGGDMEVTIWKDPAGCVPFGYRKVDCVIWGHANAVNSDLTEEELAALPRPDVYIEAFGYL